MNDRFDIVIVGGGIAGLVAGVTAAEGGASVALLEAHALGGRAQTTERDGYRYNHGPHALYNNGHLRGFLSGRGLDPAGRAPQAKEIRVVRDGQLWPLTISAIELAKTDLLRPKSRVRMLSLMARLPLMDTDRHVGTPWEEWLGNEPADVAGLLRMLSRVTTYTNAPSLDAGAALKQLKLSFKGVRYLHGGWQTIVDALAARFVRCGGTVIENREVLAVGSDGDVEITTTDGTFRASAAVLAGLSPASVMRVIGSPVIGLENVGGPVHASVLDLALDTVHDGVVFGVDEPLYLSPHAPVADLAPPGGGLVTALRYTPDGEVSSADEARTRLRQLAGQAGIVRQHVVHERFLHRLVVANAFPTAFGGGLRGRPQVDALDADNIFIAGDWVGPDGLIADAASSSGEAAGQRSLSAVASASRARV